MLQYYMMPLADCNITHDFLWHFFKVLYPMTRHCAVSVCHFITLHNCNVCNVQYCFPLAAQYKHCVSYLLDPPFVQEMKDKYQRLHSCIHPFPWLEHFEIRMEDVFTRLVIAPREKGEDSVSAETVNMFEIFEANKHCKCPKKVLVEGDPGIGKTTFSEKLCLDWVTGRTKPPFPHLPLVIFLKCRDMLSGDIYAAIADQLLPEDVSEDEKNALFEFIKENQSDVLLVIDGMDELGKEVDLDDFSKVIIGKVLPNVRLLITTRHNETALRFRRYFDSLFEIAGYTVNDAKDYITNYFTCVKKEEKGNELLSRIDEMFDEEGNVKTAEEAVQFIEFLANPLRVSLLCAATEDHVDDLPVLSPTLLYETIVSCILMRHFKKESPEENPPEDPLVHYEDEVKTLGRLARQSSEEKQMYFEKKELAGRPNTEKLGFLTTEPSASRTKRILKCSFLHRTFQEYLAARCVCEELTSGELLPEKYIEDHSKDISRFAQIFLFCAGILAAEGAIDVLDRFMRSLTREATAPQHIPNSKLHFCLLCDCVRELRMVGGESFEDLKQQLCQFIGESITWPVLSLGEFVAGERSTRWEVMCEVLTSLSGCVQELYLPHNQLADVSLLASSLASNSTLMVMDLRGNHITDLTPLEGLVEGKKFRIGVGGGKCIGEL